MKQLKQSIVSMLTVILIVVVPLTTDAADHGDTPFLIDEGRHDARLTDLYAFVRGDNLVLVVDTNSAIPTDLTAYRFPSDVKVVIKIDNHSEVLSDDPDGLGGTIVDPDRIRADFTIRIRFRKGGPKVISPHLDVISFFAGLRDDPFIRIPRIGQNIYALVLEVPLADVTRYKDTLLIWAEVRLEDHGMVELGGRALRNQFPENLCLNDFPPRKHLKKCSLVPDVIIFDTSLPTEFPNGRELTDDVVDLVGRPVEDPSPDENDLPFLGEFPYLAPPHMP